MTAGLLAAGWRGRVHVDVAIAEACKAAATGPPALQIASLRWLLRAMS